MKEYRIVSAKDYKKEELHFYRNQYFETIFIDETLFQLAIGFYNSFMLYNESPIDREEALMYAKVGTRINADLFKILHPRDETQLDAFYRVTPFHFFNNIIRFMDGMHRSIVEDFASTDKSPILDFGGGTGGISISLALHGFDVTYVESSIMCLAWMRYVSKVLNLNIKVLESGQPIEEKFNLIIAKDIIEHVVNPQNLLNYLLTLKTDEGKIYMTHFPCCGPSDMAPMHFRVDSKKEGEFIFSESDNLEYLRSGKYPSVSNNPMPEPTGQEAQGASKVD